MKLWSTTPHPRRPIRSTRTPFNPDQHNNKNNMSDTTKPEIKFSKGPIDNVIVLGYIGPDDFDKDAGAVNSMRDEANKNLLYRGGSDAIDAKAKAKIVELAGVPYGVNEKQTAKKQEVENSAATKAGRAPKTVTAVPETFVDYLTKVKATVTPEVWSAIEDEYRTVALATPLDASPSARQGAPSKANMEKAEQILTREDSAIESVVSTMSATATSFELLRDAAGKPDVTSLARLIGTFLNMKEEEAKKSL